VQKESGVPVQLVVGTSRKELQALLDQHLRQLQQQGEPRTPV
jgi:hypothetical protein